MLYPYLKRVTSLAHFGIGAADALAPLGGWLAVHQSFTHVAPALWLGSFMFFWVSGFDVIYATMDEAFDKKQGLYSLPARFGKERALQISAVLHAMASKTFGEIWFITIRPSISFKYLS